MILFGFWRLDRFIFVSSANVFEYLYGVIPTTPIRDQVVAAQLGELVKIESERGELEYYQKIRAVDTFHRYLWKLRSVSKTPFNDGVESGAGYILEHIRIAIVQTKYPAKRGITSAEDALDL